MPDPLRLLYINANADLELRRSLESHLASLEREGLVEGWHVGRILAGEDAWVSLCEQVASAQIVLLLLSADFMTSEHCQKLMAQVAEQRAARLVLVIPVLIRPVDWRGSGLDDLQATPRNGHAVTLWPNQDAAWLAVAEDIRDLVTMGTLRDAPVGLPAPPAFAGDGTQARFSSVELIDSSLDPRDSPYEQADEGLLKRLFSIDVDHLSDQGYRYDFPTIDFKFRNGGDATAFLWRFVIDVAEAEIDTTPVLSFSVTEIDGAFCVSVRNRGWGPARSCRVSIAEEALCLAFPTEALTYCGTIESGEEKPIIRLTHLQAIAGALDPLVDRRVRLPRLRGYSFTDSRGEHRLARNMAAGWFEEIDLYGTLLESICAAWECSDDHGGIHHDTAQVESFPNEHLVLTREGFVKVEEVEDAHLCKASAPSDATFVALLDPLRGLHQRSYPISRKIPPGDVERFHILVGAAMSCRLRLRFQFSVDKFGTVASDLFEVHICNSRGHQREQRYLDGDELSRATQELERKVQNGQADYWDRWQLERKQGQLARIRRGETDYPFVPTRAKPDW